MQSSAHKQSLLANLQLKEERVKRFLVNKPSDHVIRTISEVHAAAKRPHLTPFERSQPKHTPKSPSRLFKYSLQNSRNRVILSSHKQWLSKHGKSSDLAAAGLAEALFRYLSDNDQLQPNNLLEMLECRSDELCFALRNALGVEVLNDTPITRTQFMALFRPDPCAEQMLRVLRIAQVSVSRESFKAGNKVIYDCTSSVFPNSYRARSNYTVDSLLKVIEKWWMELHERSPGKVSADAVTEKFIKLGLVAELTEAREVIQSVVANEAYLGNITFKRLFGGCLLRTALLALARRVRRMTQQLSISPQLELSAYRRSLIMSKLSERSPSFQASV